ncbi:MAG: fibrobacter succinogenes major paralogous domain-containing protein [Fibrobacter sp.]|nr:fibrobacter succinogenes major paralogous domain-containing protein [Fibrobacter sp.]
MKFGLLKVFVLGSVVPLAVALNACGDDSSSTSGPVNNDGYRGGIPDTVETFVELSNYDCGKSLRCVTTYLVEYHGKAVCDGENGWVFSPLVEKMGCDFFTESGHFREEEFSSSSTELVPDPNLETEESSVSSSKGAWAYLNPDIDYSEFTDARDGQVYKTLSTSTQTWMAQNLNYDPGDVSDMGEYAWSGCYNNKADSCSKYGRLYTWQVAMNNADCAHGKECKPNGFVQGVCPSGWHLPSLYEYEVLINNFDSKFGYNHTIEALSSTAGKYLRSMTGWDSSGNGTDSSGFSALPAGYRNYHGDFYDAGRYATFWSASEFNSTDAYYLRLYYNMDDVILNYRDKGNVFSVRCFKDN